MDEFSMLYDEYSTMAGATDFASIVFGYPNAPFGEPPKPRNTKTRKIALFYNKGNEIVTFRNNFWKNVFVVVLYTLC